MTPEARALRGEILGIMEAGALARLSDEALDQVALRAFRFQCEANPVYGTFARNRGVDPGAVSDWRDIPFVPARAFREIAFVTGADADGAEAVFRTSGTTGGSSGRGAHHVVDLELYRASALASGEAFLRPRGAATNFRRVLALLPPPDAHPESSLVYMAGLFLEAWDDGGGGFLADRDWNVDPGRVARAIERAKEDEVPVLLIGTAFAFAHYVESGGKAPLPEGSVVLETGGYKGRARERPRGELYRSIESALGVPRERIVNEYGMTELLSQFYEPVLLEKGAAPPDTRWHVGPPWIRTLILRPDDLTPVKPGEEGLLAHFDLANIFSVCAVLTEDRGVAVGDGFRVLGRVAGAEPRGCSLSMEALMR